eukprot:TRINITY_DN74693_c0_g1_i1.p1 TRINITY_DN74693_c0_g1~~TRINITY_DN74693_c0_g1_i1.p1  ORF type:complete len:310 (-),score=85.52 TRINITY_DN74693_c0_g1_i1:30-959(-)
MVDYAKWDKLADDSEDEEENRKPQVHRFDRPQTVTIGKQGAEHAPEAGNEDAMEDDSDEPMEPEEEEAVAGRDHREDVLQCRALGQKALREGSVSEGVRLLEKALRLGGCPGLEDELCSARSQLATSHGSSLSAASNGAGAPKEDSRHQNGGVVEDRYRWTQTKESVEVFVFVADGSKARDVKVEVSDTNLCISLCGKQLLAGDWEFKVEPEADPDWELVADSGRRALRLLVRKAPMPGGLSVAVWWSRLLKGEPCIDVKGLEARKNDREKSDQFAKAWSEAHAMFREKVKNREPIPIDCSNADAAPAP